MPPAFVLSQNQTLKLMYDKHAAPKRDGQAGISGSRSCTNIQTGVFAYEDIWNGLICPIIRHPEVTGDRGRRPHVPSSKPTMSKSRHLSLPVNPGHRLAVKRDANGPGQTPCPVGEGHIWTAFPPVNSPFSKSYRSMTAAFRSGGRRKPARRSPEPDRMADAVLQGPNSIKFQRKQRLAC